MLQWQVMLQGESDRQGINSVFKEDKPLRLELQRKRLHQAIEITFDKYCVSNTDCRPSTSCYEYGPVMVSMPSKQHKDVLHEDVVEKKLIL